MPDVVVRQVVMKGDNDENKTVIAFLIEDLDDGCVLIPAHCKGEKEPLDLTKLIALAILAGAVL